MVRPFHVAGVVQGLALLGCISVSNHPSGRFEIVTMTVTPADGPAQTVDEAGSLQFGSVMTCDSGWYGEDGRIDACSDEVNPTDGVSILAFEWVGTGFVPLWSPRTEFFEVPDWDGPSDSWTGPIPLGSLSCELSREEQDPLVLVGSGCSGPDGGPFAVELVMDR